MLVTLLVVVLAMGARDFLGTMLVVAESHGRARTAGLMDGLGDVAQMVCTLVGVDTLNKGVNVRSILVLLVMVATSFVVTLQATKYANRLRKEQP